VGLDELVFGFPSLTIMYYQAVFLFLKFLFIYFWLCRIFIAAHGLSLIVASGGCSPVAVLGLLIAVASLVEHGIWDAGAQ